MHDDPRRSPAFAKLTARQQTFVQHYRQGGDPVAACIAAGYSGARAARRAGELLRQPGVQRALAELQEERTALLRLRAALERIVFGADMADFEDFIEGRATLAELKARGVDTSLVRRVVVRGESGRGVPYRSLDLYDRLMAAQRLARLLGVGEQAGADESGGEETFAIALGDAEPAA